MRLHASLRVHCCATGWGCMCVRACGCTQGWGHTRVCAVGEQTAVVLQGEPHRLFAAPGSASPPSFASWSPFPLLPLLWGCPLCSQLGAGPCRPLIRQRKLCPAPSCLSLVSSSSVPPPLASHWSAAALSRPQLPLIGQMQLCPAPAGLSLVSGCSGQPLVVSHWSAEAMAPLLPLIG